MFSILYCLPRIYLQYRLILIVINETLEFGLSLLYGIFIVIFLQTLTTVLITHAVMVDLVKMVSTVIPVTAREDIQEITVKQVSFCLCDNTFFMSQPASSAPAYMQNALTMHATSTSRTIRPAKRTR